MIARQLDYTHLAQLHRPTDPAAIAAEIRRLSLTLKPRDIASALQIDTTTVLQALRQPIRAGADIPVSVPGSDSVSVGAIHFSASRVSNRPVHCVEAKRFFSSGE